MFPESITWFPPSGWSGPYPVLYWTFDTSEKLILKEATQEASFYVLVQGQVDLFTEHNVLNIFDIEYVYYKHGNYKKHHHNVKCIQLNLNLFFNTIHCVICLHHLLYSIEYYYLQLNSTVQFCAFVHLVMKFFIVIK